MLIELTLPRERFDNADDDVTEEVAAVVRECLEVPGAGAALLEDAAVGWARRGIPVEAALRAVYESVRPPRLGSADPRAAVELLHELSAAVSRGYIDGVRDSARSAHGSVRALAAALLGGEAGSGTARRCGHEIAPEYWILALEIAPAPSRDRFDGARRTLLRIEAALARLGPARALPALSAGGGSVLFPADIAETTVEEVFAELARTAEATITGAVVRSAAGEIPVGAAQAHELLDMVQRLGPPGGLHRFADLALEYQLTRPGAGRTMLAERLEPLGQHPELLTTLACFFAHDTNRRRTARTLHIHPNTVDHRLKRIATLTGLDATRSAALWYLRSALIARSYVAAEERGRVPGPAAAHPRFR